MTSWFRPARAIAFGNEGKLRILADLLAQHHPEQTLIFTDDNATVYRISQDFLIPAITHKTPVKERHDILQRFRLGEYPILVASRVLNEGVDVPEASIAIVLSGTGSTREYVQRLGRVLRKGKDPNKLALLYEVIAENTSEENTARRRQPNRSKPKLSVVENPYATNDAPIPRAAEKQNDETRPSDRWCQEPTLVSYRPDSSYIPEYLWHATGWNLGL